MAGSPDRDSTHYEPGNPRTFGNPPDISGLEGPFLAFLDHYSSPSARMRLLHGQDPAMEVAYQLLRRDRLLSSFPDSKQGAQFLDRVLPVFIQECTGGQPNLLDELGSNREKFFSQLLFDFFTGQEGAEAGGQETLYIRTDQPSQAQSYEYIGERLMRIVRSSFCSDQDPKTKAFFGWIGRHLMKRVVPETDFSLDRHNEMVAKDKRETARRLREFQKRVRRGVQGDLTVEKAYEFFRGLSQHVWNLPVTLGAETPVQYQVGSNLGINFDDHHGSIYDFMPYTEDGNFGWGHEKNNFQWFLEMWRKTATKDDKDEVRHRNYWRNYWKERFPKIFGDVPEGEEALAPTPEQLLPKWFEMLRVILLRGTGLISLDAYKFNVTYFRFIRNRGVAAGYAHAQEHIVEILQDLPGVLRLTEEEVQARFMQGEPKILHDSDDLGKNTGNDIYRDTDFEQLGEGLGDVVETPPQPIVLTDEERGRTDEEWYEIICNGPNAQLYKQLEQYIGTLFSDREWLLGVGPLFFGNWLSDQEAKLFLTDGFQEFYEQRRKMTPMEIEKERIEELRAGLFALPKKPEDLLTNAARQLDRLQRKYDQLRQQATTFNVDAITQGMATQEQIMAIRRVRVTLNRLLNRRREEEQP